MSLTVSSPRQPVTQAALRGGETIRLGDTEMVIQVERRT